MPFLHGERIQPIKTTYSTVARRMDSINQDNKYKAIVEKLIQSEPNAWPKFGST